MNEHSKDELIAMRENLGHGHKGNILITTQERVNANQPPIATDIIDEATAMELIHRYNTQHELLEACKGMNEAEANLEKIIAYCKTDDDTYEIAEDLEKLVLVWFVVPRAAVAKVKKGDEK